MEVMHVIFHDIQTRRNWRTKEEIAVIEPVRCHAFGVKVEGMEGYVYLASIYTEEGDASEITIIPEGCIEKMDVFMREDDAIQGGET